jgi:hypothetical protein
MVISNRATYEIIKELKKLIMTYGLRCGPSRDGSFLKDSK